jgi:hypothetical protein
MDRHRPASFAGCIALVLLTVLPATAQVRQLPADVPPRVPPGADLTALAGWLGRWLPVVGAASYAMIEDTGDFLAHASDSVTHALIEECTLVLHQRSLTTVRAERIERRRTVRVPLGELDTTAVQPKVRRAGMLLGRPHVMLTGQLVVPLLNQSRTRFITIASEQPPGDSLVAEHLVPFLFAIEPAMRSAQVIRRAAALCRSPDRLRDSPDIPAAAVYGN